VTPGQNARSGVVLAERNQPVIAGDDLGSGSGIASLSPLRERTVRAVAESEDFRVGDRAGTVARFAGPPSDEAEAVGVPDVRNVVAVSAALIGHRINCHDQPSR